MRPPCPQCNRATGRRATDTALESVREEERAYIARELHDELGQLLAALRLDLHLMQQTPSPALLEDMDQLLLAAITSLRRIAADLRPPALAEGGLYFALQTLRSDFEHRNGIPCVLAACEADLGVDDRYSTAVYRLVQESLTNIGRHAGASRVSLRFERLGGALEIVIQDDGCGIEAADLCKAGSFGLLGMRERVAALGGQIAIEGAARPRNRTGEGGVDDGGTPGGGVGGGSAGGTRIAIRLPLPGGAAHQ